MGFRDNFFAGSELSGGELRRSDWFDHKVTQEVTGTDLIVVT